MTTKLHYTVINYLNKLGIAKCVSMDEGRPVLTLGTTVEGFATGKELVTWLKAKDKAGELAPLVSQVEGFRAKSGIVYRRYKVAYKVTNGNCGDALANAIREAVTVVDEDGESHVDMGLLAQLAADNSLTLKGRNPGHMLMNLSNVLRGRARREEPVVVDGSPFQGSVNASGSKPKPKAAKATEAAPQAAAEGEAEGEAENSAAA